MVRCVPGDGYSMPMVGTCLCDDYGVLHAGSREGNQYQDLVHQIPGTDSRCVGLLVFFLCDHPPQAFLSHRIAVGSFLVPWNADRAISLDPHPEDYRTEQTGSEILLLVLAGVDDLYFPGQVLSASILSRIWRIRGVSGILPVRLSAKDGVC